MFKTIILKLGRRKTDAIVRVNFFKERVLIRYDVSFLDGEFLEPVPYGFFNRIPNSRPAIILYKKDWSKPYFVREREPDDLWTEDRYFFLAEKLFQEKGILNP